jgi:hypothetical protein
MGKTFTMSNIKGSKHTKIRSDAKLNLEKFAEICEWLAEDKSYASLRATDPAKWPTWSAVTRYRHKVKAAHMMYEEARRTQAEQYLEAYNELMENPPKYADFEDKKEYFAEQRMHDCTLRALQFKINRLGPIFNQKSFNPKQEIEINDKRSDIQVVNYAQTDSDGSILPGCADPSKDGGKDLEH